MFTACEKLLLQTHKKMGVYIPWAFIILALRDNPACRPPLWKKYKLVKEMPNDLSKMP